MNQGLTIYENFTGDTIYSLQVHQKRPMCPTCDNAFIGLANYTIPFMFTRAASPNDITSFEIRDINDDVIETLSNELVSIINAGDIDYIVCNFQPYGIAEPLACDLYYYQIECSTEVYYSEIFKTVVKDIDVLTTDLAINGAFTTDLTGWNASGATWSSGTAQLDSGDSISQTTLGTSFVKLIIDVTLANTDSQFRYGIFSYTLNSGENEFWLPSGTLFYIENTGGATYYIESVSIYEVEKVECYNLIVSRNSCNKNNIPYTQTAYTDVFIFDAELAEPEYKREDEFDEDGNKNKTQTFLKILKQWVMQSSQTLYEPLVDELNKLPLSDCIYIFNDIWKKEFKVYQETLDLEIQTEWIDEDKCNASVKLIINETIALSNSCCEEITDIDCCDSFQLDVESTPTGPDTVDVVVTIPEGNCEGLVYRLITYDNGTQTDSEVFTDSIEFIVDGTTTITYGIRGSKFGCPDVEYQGAAIS